MDIIRSILDYIKSAGLYPDMKMIESAATEPEIIIEGKKYLQFCSNNYLGVACDHRVKDAVVEAVRKYGMGSGGSRLISGNLDIHHQLETCIANFKNKPSAITFLSGYMANVGVIMPLVNVLNLRNGKMIESKTAIFSDELNHASIIDGCRLTKAERNVYQHKNIQDLERLLSKSKAKIKLIVTDGVFSMDGDIAPLDEIVKLAGEYKAMVMVDDAHGSGILGENGRGTCEYFNVEDKTEIIMGTFTKSFGGIGGFIAAENDFIDYFRVTARTYIFSAPIPPPISAGLIKAIHILENEPQRRINLLKNVDYLKQNLNRIGFNTLGSETQIIPTLIGKEEKAIQFSQELFERKIFIPCVRWPAVPKKQARLRITVSSLHTIKQMDYLLESMESIGRSLKII